MKHIRQKLNNRDGVSILIALVGFLAAAMIAAVIVSAAMTSAKRVADDKTENQAHLTLESAAQIVREGIEDTVYSCDTKTATGTFADEMEDAVNNRLMDGFTISLDNYDMDTVDVTFVMGEDDDNYDLVFTLCIEDMDEEMYISADGVLSGNTVTWTVISINGLGA